MIDATDIYHHNDKLHHNFTAGLLPFGTVIRSVLSINKL